MANAAATFLEGEKTLGVAKSIEGAQALASTARRLGLKRVDRVKYALSWYLSRRPLLTAMAPAQFKLTLPDGLLVPLRPNGIDRNTMADIFGERLYELSATGVQRILDLGANIGMATLFFASRFPDAEFACVEPSPGNCSVLREAIRLNGIRATVFEGAVGVVPGEADLDVGHAPDQFSLTPYQSTGRKIRVRQFVVPEILSALGWDTVDLMKIDIEGYEKTLFRNGKHWLPRVKLIVGEAHGHVNYGIDEVRADLAPLGFEVKLKSYDKKSVHGLTVFEARNVAI